MIAVVSNTSPLSALYATDLLWLLPRLYDTILVPPEVADEYTIVGRVLPNFVEVRKAPSPYPVGGRLHLGEAAALALARETKAEILTDDYGARRYAQQHDIPLIGSVGVLLRAKASGILLTIADPLRRLGTDLYLSDELIAEVLRRAGEG